MNPSPVRAALVILLLSFCPARSGGAAEIAPLGSPGLSASHFPEPTRPVAPIISDRWRGEDERERVGEPGDPRLPGHSADVALMIHMYHEIEQPFALLANLAPGLRPGGRLGIVDVDDATERHGTPRALLEYELAAVGYRPVAFQWLLVQLPRSEYLAIFEPPATPLSPESVHACASSR